jgi:hypothetical protein
LSLENVTPAGFNYHLISVFGSQSTGKSTLLNHLFGTQFSVMSELERRQTTKGIWLSNNKKQGDAGSAERMADNILVMDVEGTDGRERGEDQDFERKSALFALATSEVLIVNIWEHQVGLYQGANMGLLKTVFEVNLQLFLKDKQYVSFRSSASLCASGANLSTVPLTGPSYSSSFAISLVPHHSRTCRRHYWKTSPVFGTLYRNLRAWKSRRFTITLISNSTDCHTRVISLTSL